MYIKMIIEVKKPIKHNALCDTFGELITGNTEMKNTEKTKVPLSPAAFSEDNASHKEDFGNLIDQIKLDKEEKRLNKLLNRKVEKMKIKTKTLK